ncbi:hypothetical protein CYMTET_32974 [Cymbomonas tetramitiformis]|uniref:Uncharacterized protein n=1 Tax=Cymbomonas tetramitiformis TaxID=36881 RepID=A0AAE0FEC1_9CHLO|nr:hypothetical protein CYMTET_32974 [Cymbomonas tetramitiformis]
MLAMQFACLRDQQDDDSESDSEVPELVDGDSDSDSDEQDDMLPRPESVVNEPDTEEDIQHIIKSKHADEYANIMLFNRQQQDVTAILPTASALPTAPIELDHASDIDWRVTLIFTITTWGKVQVKLEQLKQLLDRGEISSSGFRAEKIKLLSLAGGFVYALTDAIHSELKELAEFLALEILDTSEYVAQKRNVLDGTVSKTQDIPALSSDAQQSEITFEVENFIKFDNPKLPKCTKP